jgi:hypothetical protein
MHICLHRVSRFRFGCSGWFVLLILIGFALASWKWALFIALVMTAAVCTELYKRKKVRNK